MAVYAALLDACVLVPISLADILLRTAERQLFRPAWSNRILEEVRRAVVRIHPELDAELIQRRLRLMSQSFPGALIEGFHAIERGLELPDPDDAHVLAAAVRGHCQAIVTHNLKDFPARALDVFDVEAISPDEFLLNQLELAPRAVLDCLHEQAAAAKDPSLSVEEVLVSIGRAGAPNFTDEVLRRL